MCSQNSNAARAVVRHVTRHVPFDKDHPIDNLKAEWIQESKYDGVELN